MPDAKKIDMGAWRGKRAEWTTARGKTPVKQGAVRSVSVGDGLDKIYKASLKGYRPLQAAIAAFKKDVATYVTKGGKGVAPVLAAPWVKQFLKDLDALDLAVKAHLKTLSDFGPYLRTFYPEAMDIAPTPDRMQKTQEYLAKDKSGSMTWAEAAFIEGIDEYYTEFLTSIKKYLKVTTLVEQTKLERNSDMAYKELQGA